MSQRRPASTAARFDAQLRRGGRDRPRRPADIKQQIIGEATRSLTDGTTELCEHLEGDPGLTERRWFAEAPDLIRCGLCTVSYAFTADPHDLRCHLCNVRGALPRTFDPGSNPPVMLVANICSTCLP